MAAGLHIDLATGHQTQVEEPPRPPSPLRQAEDKRAAAYARLRFLADEWKASSELRASFLGEMLDDLLTLMGYEDG